MGKVAQRKASETQTQPFRLKQRDRRSIELKFRYMVSREAAPRRQNYDVTIYFFLPYSFNITPASYDRNNFYGSLKLYLRFNTPSFTAKELLARESRISPLVRIERMVRAARRDGTAIDPDSCIYEAKLLACIYKSLLRDGFSDIGATIGDTSGGDGLYSRFKETRDVARRYHKLTSSVRRRLPGVEPRIVQRMQMIDEHLSLLIEKYATSLLQRLLATGDHVLSPEIARIIAKEIRYREKRDYPSVVRGTAQEAKLEENIYREKILKRYASEVLFFDVRRRDTAKGTEHILYAVAAGLAMIFATSIAFLGQSTFGSLTTSLFILLVASYMLKDRMKDFFRDIFRKSLGRYFYDRSARLYGARFRRKLALVRERATFVRESKLDAAVVALRNRQSFEQELAHTTEESIFSYHKRIEIHTKTMRSIHRRIVGLADISIIDLGGFLHHLSSQRGFVPSISEKGIVGTGTVRTGGVQLHAVERIYHLNMVVHMRSSGGENLFRHRIIVDARGIKRIEPISVSPTN